MKIVRTKNKTYRDPVCQWPIRMCISCGKKKRKWDLIRLTLDKTATVIQDLKMDRPGRGAYVCDDSDCLKILGEYELLCKAFKIKMAKNVV